MSGPVFKPLNFQAPIVKIDKPHAPYGQHVDHITPFGCGSEKLRIDNQGSVISQEFVLQGGAKIDLTKI